MPPPDYIKKLQEAIRETNACESYHVATVPVTEYFRGEIAWTGKVEVFNLIGYPEAKRCYAWSEDHEHGTAATIVLNVPPVDSPESAVQMAIAAKARRK